MIFCFNYQHDPTLCPASFHNPGTSTGVLSEDHPKGKQGQRTDVLGELGNGIVVYQRGEVSSFC